MFIFLCPSFFLFSLDPLFLFRLSLSLSLSLSPSLFLAACAARVKLFSKIYDEIVSNFLISSHVAHNLTLPLPMLCSRLLVRQQSVAGSWTSCTRPRQAVEDALDWPRLGWAWYPPPMPVDLFVRLLRPAAGSGPGESSRNPFRLQLDTHTHTHADAHVEKRIRKYVHVTVVHSLVPWHQASLSLAPFLSLSSAPLLSLPCSFLVHVAVQSHLFLSRRAQFKVP